MLRGRLLVGHALHNDLKVRLRVQGGVSCRGRPRNKSRERSLSACPDLGAVPGVARSSCSPSSCGW